jgi:hypothetical protein
MEKATFFYADQAEGNRIAGGFVAAHVTTPTANGQTLWAFYCGGVEERIWVGS